MSARAHTGFVSTLGRAFARGASPRLLGVFVVTLLLPTLLAMLPFRAFFHEHLGNYPGARDAVTSLGSLPLVQLVTRAGEPAAARSLGQGLVASLLVGLFLAPFLAGAAVAEARSPSPLRMGELVRGGGEHYGRMVRMALVGLLPFAGAAIVSAVALGVASKVVSSAVLESSATRAERVRDVVVLAAFWMSHVTMETARAHVAAEPGRRSVFVAWMSGILLLLRRPHLVLGITAITGLAGAALAAIVVAVRMRLAQDGGPSVVFAFVLGQLAVAAVAWGRTSGLVALTELVRADGPSQSARR